MDEADYEVIPTINRVYTFTELQDDKKKSDIIFEPKHKKSLATYSFVFKANTNGEFSFIAKYDINFTQLINIEYITRIVILKNGVGVFDGLILNTPIIVNANDTVIIRVTKTNPTIGKFQLVGNTI